MKYIRILGLAAIAAAAVMAFVGAGTASATTVICATGPEESVCGAGAGKAEYSGAITATSTNATLATNLSNVICSHSETTLNPSSSTGEPITGTVSALSFTGCKTEGTNIACTVTVRNLTYNASLKGTIGGKAGVSTLTVTDALGAGAKVVCGAVIECEFLTNEADLPVTNGSPTTATATNIVLSHETGIACPETATWSATYAVTSPAGLTVL